MPSQGRSIQATVELNIKPFTTQIGNLQKELDKLSKGLTFDNTSIARMEESFILLQDIMKGATLQAKEINKAFANINGVKKLIANLESAKTYLAELRAEADGVGSSISRTANAQGKLTIGIKEQLNLMAERNANDEREIAYLDEQLALQKEINALTQQGTAESISQAEALIKQLDADTEIFTVLKEEIALEKEKLGLIEEENAMLNEQGALRQKNATTGATGKNKLDQFGYLPSRITSMALTMWGFNEIMDIYGKSSSYINAKGSMQYFGQALQKDQRYLDQTGQSSQQVAESLKGVNAQLGELQKTYRKIDMTVVGANAEETAYKYGLQADKIGDLSEVMAIYGSEFVKQGRSQEDSILAMNDALDGELRRLKEVNVGKEELEAHGWTGDQASMIDALKEIADERGYTLTAQNITNLSDAIEVLELRISHDLVGAFESLEPILLEVAKNFDNLISMAEWLSRKIGDLSSQFGYWINDTFGTNTTNKISFWGTKVLGGIITGLIGLYVIKKVASIFTSGWGKILDIFGKTKSIDKASESLGKLGNATNTGGTVGTGGSWKDGIKNWGKNLAKNLGKMAEAFIYVAVAIAMAWALLKEAMYLIADIGKQWEEQKAEFNQGIEFIKEYGIWILGISGVMALALSYFSTPNITKDDYINMAKTGFKVAEGLAIAMGLIAEAILLLIAPMVAIELLGYMYGELNQGAISNGMKVINMYADALHYIANDGSVQAFILGLGVASVILGFTLDTVAIPLVLGIATALTLVAEAIVMLIAPLVAIEMLGEMANELNQDAINKGSEMIKLVSDCLIALEPSIRNLLLVDMEVFGVNLVDMANKWVTGKTGLDSLVNDIIPNLISFVKDFNNLDFTDADSVNAENVQAVTQIANDIPPLFNAVQNLNNAMGTTNLLGNIWGAVGGGLSGKIGMGLKSKLDQMYNDIVDIMDFASKVGNLSTTGTNNASAIGQTANLITQLKAKLDLLASTISTASVNIHNASKQMGTAIKTGFNDGASGFEQAVVSVIAKGISEVQQRYQTWHSGGETSAQKLADGFDKLGGKLKSSVSEEMGYALSEIDNYKDDFYNKGAMLGQSLIDGFKSKKGLDQNSPAKITKSIREELGYSMEALNVGRQMMYRGGQALGSALATGYADSNTNLRTNVDVLAQKGVSNEQLQATARKVQANNNKQGQTQQSLTPIIHIDMSNSMVIGIQDLDARIKESVERVIISINSPNGAIGY